MRRFSLAFLGFCLLVAPLSAAPKRPNALSEEDAYAIALDAYIYFYPLLTMDITRRQMTNGKDAMHAPANSFLHVRTFPPASFRDVVRPNFDTLYSIAWLDLTKEPVVVSAPDTAGRYYLLPMLDMWSDVFAVPGKRTSGTSAKQFAVVPPGWDGTLPSGVQKIQATTPYVWIIGRTQTDGASDYAAVHKIQDGYSVVELSEFGKPSRGPKPATTDPSIDMKTSPLDQVNSLSGQKYFEYAAELLKLHPPHATDWSLIQRIERLGIRAGQSFDFKGAEPEVQDAISRAATEGLKQMKAKIPTLARSVNGWQLNTDTMGVYGNYYLKRAIVAMVGLGANQPEDAIYPLSLGDSAGKPLDGSKKYQITFTKGSTPPVDAFWSITLYDKDGFQVANHLNRFAIGDRDPLVTKANGTIDIYIQHEAPGGLKDANWLPAPKAGEFNLTMRLYAPKAPALDGRWAPPVIREVK